jgi:hypothetical protein
MDIHWHSNSDRLKVSLTYTNKCSFPETALKINAAGTLRTEGLVILFRTPGILGSKMGLQTGCFH